MRKTRPAKNKLQAAVCVVEYPEVYIGNDTLNRASRIGALENQPRKERPPERSRIVELADKNGHPNTLSMHIARQRETTNNEEFVITKS